jgi:hypothetical protein
MLFYRDIVIIVIIAIITNKLTHYAWHSSLQAKLVEPVIVDLGYAANDSSAMTPSPASKDLRTSIMVLTIFFLMQG